MNTRAGVVLTPVAVSDGLLRDTVGGVFVVKVWTEPYDVPLELVA